MARSRFTVLGSLIAISLALFAWTLPAPSKQPNASLSVTAKPGEWRYLNADPLSTRYSPLDQITKDNFKDSEDRLALEARRSGPRRRRSAAPRRATAIPCSRNIKSEATPIMANGVLYTSPPAASASSPRSMRRPASNCGCGTGSTRAAATARRRAGTPAAASAIGPTAREERIFVITTGFYLVALNAKTGVPVQAFGVNGAVDLMKELNVDFDHVTRIGNSSPPMVYRDTVIVPPALEEGFVPSSMRNTPGYVMAFDARTGKQKWAFHTVPKNGEFGAETWEQNANAYTGNTGVWAPISVDPELGYAYLPSRRRPTITMAAIGSAAICSPIRSSPSISRPAGASGTTRSRTTTSGTTISRPLRRW